HALGQHTKSRHRHDGTGKADPVIQPENADECEGEEAAKHHQVALGKIHDFSGFVNKDETERDQAVNAAERDAADQLLNEVQHSFPSPPGRAAILFDCLIFASHLSTPRPRWRRKIAFVLRAFSPKPRSLSIKW